MEEINARGIYYRDLNEQIKKLASSGVREIILNNINGQRYIGVGIKSPLRLIVNGTPGNDLASFASNVDIIVYGNGQDGICNTMNDGKVVIHGDVGDILGYGMRGGKLYIRGNAGYRVGIHMKGYKDKQPVIIIGGRAGDFFGEYMAGGRLVLLGLDRGKDQSIIGNHVAVGIHGGVIYVRGDVQEYQVGLEVKIKEVNKEDRKELEGMLAEYCQEFNLELEEIMAAKFTKLIPASSRPYGNMYAY